MKKVQEEICDSCCGYCIGDYFAITFFYLVGIIKEKVVNKF